MKLRDRLTSFIQEKNGSNFSLKLLLQQNAIIVSFLILFLILSILSDAFLSSRNIRNVLDQSSQIGIIACGMTIVIISGGFDLSVGAIYAITGVTTSVIANLYGTPISYAVGMILGLVIGLINGTLIAKFRINSFIATLASSLIIRGVGNVFVSGRLITVTATNFNFLGRGSIFGIRVSVYLLALIVILTWIMLLRTKIGRHIYATGGCAEAALLSGVRVDLVRILAFGISGICAGIAGVLSVSRISTGLMDVGSGLELDSIAAVVIGGTSIMGGQGAIWRTVFGVLMLKIILNGFNILTIPPFYQQIFEGLIILVAVAVDSLPKREV